MEKLNNRVPTRSVELRFPLRKFHQRLADALDRKVDAPGVAGEGCYPLAHTDGDHRGYLLQAIMSKFDDGRADSAREKRTWDKFHKAEASCFEANQRLSIKGNLPPLYGRAISLARRINDRLLGNFSWDAARLGMRWGPGSSTRLPRRMSDAAYKYSGHPETTSGNAAAALACFLADPAWQQAAGFDPEAPLDVFTFVEGNRIVTVPKDYKSLRTIAIEPDMNMFVQLGVGSAIRRRLRLMGVDLDDQTRNQTLALDGSVDGRLATIDLSMASDTISRVLFNMLIRPDWREALEQSRSPFGVLPSGEKIFYQKFASMGNGTTFDVESLIFWSLTVAWCFLHGAEGSDVSVFGDDIILPSHLTESFCGLLRFCGLTPNESKSYWTGSFRESCGKHFFSGREITPFFVRRPVQHLTDLFLLHNNLVRWCRRSGEEHGPGSALGDLLAYVRHFAPAKWRKPRLPDGYGDGAFIECEGNPCSLTPHPGGWEYWQVMVLSQETEIVNCEVPGLLPKAFLRLSRNPHRLWGYIPEDGKPSEIHPSKGGTVREVKALIPWFTPY